MAKIKITEKQAALLKTLKPINEEGEETGVKSVGTSIGEKVIRIVISGENLLKLKDRALLLITRQDPEAKVAYFDKTNKIVGTIKNIKLDSVERDLRSLDPTIIVQEKPIVKSLKEIKKTDKKKIKITREQYNRVKNLVENIGVKGGLDRVTKTFKKAFIDKDVKNLKENKFNLFDIIAKYIKDPNDIEAEIRKYEMMGFDGLSAPLQANLMRDMDFITMTQIESDDDQLRREIGEEKFNINKPNTSVPKLDKAVGHRKSSIHEDENIFKQEVNNLIKFLYGKVDYISDFWENHGLSYSKLINLLFKKKIILRNDGAYELSKSFGTPEAAVTAVTNLLKPLVHSQELDEKMDPAQKAFEEKLAIQMFKELQESYSPEKGNDLANKALSRMMKDGLVEYDTEVDHDDHGRAIGAYDYFWFTDKGIAEIKTPQDIIDGYFYSDHDDDGGERATFSAMQGGVDETSDPTTAKEPEYTKPVTPKIKEYKTLALTPEIAIMSDSKGGLYVLNYWGTPKKDFFDYAQVGKTYVGMADGEPDFDYDDFEIEPYVIDNYVNDNINQLSKGEGLEAYESGIDFVKIDKPTKDEIIKIFDKDKNVINALASLKEAEAKSPEEVKSALSKELAPPANPVKKTPEAIKAALKKKRDEELKRRSEKGEMEEMTSAASSGAFTAPMNTSVVKRKIVPEEEPIDETTTAASSGQYTANAFPNIDRDGKFKDTTTKVNEAKTPAQKKTQWPKGSFVTFDKCTKMNNNKDAQNGGCNQGAVSNVVKLKSTKQSVISPSLDENAKIEFIAKKTGKTIEEVTKIIKSKISTSN